jgi:hypothetical protein
LALLIAFAADSWSQPQPEAQSQGGQQQATSDQRGTDTSPFVIKILPPINNPEEAKRPAKHEYDKEPEWWLVKLTGVLAFIGFLQTAVFGWQGIQLRKTVKHLAISERAHVSGGANWIRDNDGNITNLVATINNYGKTAATIGTVATTICDEAELDTTFPGWGVKVWQGHQFTNEWRGYVFGQVSGQKITPIFQFEPGRVIAGRIWYRDIFKGRHSVGFLLKTDDLTAVGRADFWEEREKEKDPNE